MHGRIVRFFREVILIALRGGGVILLVDCRLRGIEKIVQSSSGGIGDGMLSGRARGLRGDASQIRRARGTARSTPAESSALSC